MKLKAPSSGLCRGGSPRPDQGFTLPEIFIAMTVFLLVVAGIIYANLFGLRMFQVNETKLKATEWSRKTFGKITDEVHFCDTMYVGSINTNGIFEALLDGETQQGNGLLIYPTTNAASYIVYYVNPADQTFRRTDQAGNAIILADSVTNSMVFSGQDFSGNVLTNKENNRVIHLKLEFSQAKRFMQEPDNYKLETSMTRRVLH